MEGKLRRGNLDEPRELDICNTTLLRLKYLRGACTSVTYMPSILVTGPSLATHPNHTVIVVTLSMELEVKLISSLLGFDLISDMAISAERWQTGSELIRTCVDDVERLGTVKCIDDGALQIGPDFIQRPARMIINVAAMPCVIWKITGLLQILGLP